MPVGRDGGAGRLRHPELRFAGRWAVSSLLFLALAVLFGLSFPIGAGPDEPAQVIKAASTVRGQIVGPSLPPGGGSITVVRVPDTFVSVQREPPCMDFHVTRGAGCVPPLRISWKLKRTTTYVGRYPPLYYLFVGLPTLASDHDVAIYAMRAASALLSALLLGLALAVAWRWARRRLMVAAVALAATPTAVFLASAINPNGLEIAAAIAAWTSGLILVGDHADRPPPGLLGAFAVSAGVFAVTEALAVVWLGLLSACLVALDGRGVLAILRRRAGRVAAGAAASVAAASAVYVVVAKAYRVAPLGTPVAPGASWAHVIGLVWKRSAAVLAQAVGSFGQPDTFAPVYLWFPWLVVILAGAVVAVAAGRRRGGRRPAMCLLGLILASALVPGAVMASHARVDGIVWQARDGLPLYVGIPLLIASVVDVTSLGRPSWLGRSIDVAVALLVAAGMAVALLRVLRRYTVGLGRTVDPLALVPGRWDPPVPTLLLIVGAVAVPAVYGLWLLTLGGAAPGAPASSRAGPSASAVPG